MFSYNYERIEASSQTYSKVIRLLNEAWSRVHGEGLELGSGTPSVRFEKMVEMIEAKLSNNAGATKEIADIIDVESSGNIREDIGKVVERIENPDFIGDVDDLTPNEVKDAIYEVADRFGRNKPKVDVKMADFLRECLRVVFDHGKRQGRLNVGPNRHFPRLFQYLCECEEETDGGGIRIGRIGPGRIGMNPTDPKVLRVTIQAEYL